MQVGTGFAHTKQRSENVGFSYERLFKFMVYLGF